MKLKNTLTSVAAGSALLIVGATSSSFANELPSGDFYDSPQLYLGADLSQNKADFDGIKPSITALNLIAGAEFSPYLAAETRLGFGISDGSKTESLGQGAELKLTVKQKLSLGAYIKPQLPVNEQFTIYALAGVTHLKADLKVSGSVNGTTVISESDSDSGTDFSYGFGAAYKATDNVSIKAEYINLYDKKDVKITGFNLGAVYHF